MTGPQRGPGALTAEVRPPWPFRLPSRSSGDGLNVAGGGTVRRLLASDGPPVLATAWRRGDGAISIRAEPLDRSAGRARLEQAISQMRFALAVDEDLGPFARSLRGDRHLGPELRARPHFRPPRHASPWEALAWAITAQLIEAREAVRIQRRIVARFGPRHVHGGRVWRDAPSAELVARLAPVDLVATGLAPRRAAAMVRCAKETARGRLLPADGSVDRRRLLSIRDIGPWTLRCLELTGLGDPDALPAGDLGYIKLVGALAGEGRRATIAEVEAAFERYAPWRGLAGSLALTALRRIASTRPLRLAEPPGPRGVARPDLVRHGRWRSGTATGRSRGAARW